MYYKFLLFLCAFVAVISLGSCEGITEDRKSYIPKPPEQKLDSIAKWLDNPQNLADSNYLSILNSRITQQESRKLYDSVAQSILFHGGCLNTTSQYNSAFLYSTLRFLKQNETQLSPRYISALSYNIGVQYRAGQPHRGDSAIYWLKKTFSKADNYYLLRNTANAKTVLSRYYLEHQEIDSALQFTQEALAIYEQVRDTGLQSLAWTYRYLIYETLNANREAENCLNKSLSLARLQKDTNGLISAYINKNLLFQKLHPIDEKIPKQIDNMNLTYIDTFTKLYRAWKTPVPKFQFHVFYNKVYIAVLKKEYSQAKTYLDTCKMAAIQSGSVQFNITYFIIKAFYEVNAKGQVENIAEYEAILTELEMYEDFSNLYFLSDILVENAKSKQDYKEGLHYTNIKNQARDSIWNQQMRGQVFELEKKYETQKKEQQILLQSQTIQAQRGWIGVMALSLLGLGLGIALFFSRQRQRLLQKEQIQQQVFTKQLFENTEDERKRIAYDLHDSIGHELLSLKVQTKDSHEKIDLILEEVRNISRNLHPIMFEKVGLQISVEQLVENFQNKEKLFVTADIGYQTNTLPFQVELQVYRIIQEALSNVKKYAQANAAKVSISTTSSAVTVNIKDNGKGFELNKTLESGKAFGLYSMLERSKAIGGQANIKSSEKGTDISILIPFR